MCVDNSDVSVGFSDPVLEAIELVAVHLLEPIPQEKGETVSVQGRLRKHTNFWLNDLDASSFVRGIIPHRYHLPLVVLPWPVFKFNLCSALQHEQFELLVNSLRLDALSNLVSVLWCVASSQW